MGLLNKMCDVIKSGSDVKMNTIQPVDFELGMIVEEHQRNVLSLFLKF